MLIWSLIIKKYYFLEIFEDFFQFLWFILFSYCNVMSVMSLELFLGKPRSCIIPLTSDICSYVLSTLHWHFSCSWIKYMILQWIYLKYGRLIFFYNPIKCLPRWIHFLYVELKIFITLSVSHPRWIHLIGFIDLIDSGGRRVTGLDIKS